MTEKITIMTASTNLTSGKTTTTTTTLPPEIMELPKNERNLAASRDIIENDKSLTDSEDEVRERLGPLLEEEEASTYIKQSQNITIINNINAPHVVVNINPQDQSRNIVNITPANVFSELQKIVSDQIHDVQERLKLLSKIQELEEKKYSSSFADKYYEFILLAEKHIKIFNLILPFLPVLVKFFMGK